MYRRYWIVKNTVETEMTVKGGYAAVGWSDVNFSEYFYNGGKDSVIDAVIKAYGYYEGRYAGRKKGEISRFLSINKGDLVIVPCFKGFYIGESTGVFEYNKSYAKIDRANVLMVNFKKSKDGLPLCFSREGKNTKLSTKIGSRHMLLEVWEEKLKNEIENLYTHSEDYSITNILATIENEQKDILKRSIIEKLSDYSDTWLDAKGSGFEKLISNLFEVAGYKTRILSKKVGNGYADADIVATRISKLGSDFNEVIYIQAKHHTGQTGSWGKEQLELFKDDISKKSGFDGLYRITDNDGEELEIDTSNIKFILITSAVFSFEADDESGIILIDRNKLSSMIAENIDYLDPEVRYKLGYYKQYQAYSIK